MDFKKLRLEANYTQTELAEKLAVKQSAVAMWETGKSSPRTKHIRKLSELLNVSTDVLLACFKN